MSTLVNYKTIQVPSPNPPVNSAGLSLANSLKALADTDDLKANLSGATFTGGVIATSFAGSGASLTSIPESAITNLVSDLAAKASLTGATFTGSIAATSFSGSGASLTSIPESAVTNLTSDLASKANLSGATFTGAVAATSFSGSGASLTSIPESAITNLTTDLAAKALSSRSISTTSPLAGGGDLTANRTLSIAQANTTTDGYLSHTDWNSFNGKGAGSVTSVAMTLPSFLSVSGTPITTTGTLALSLATQSAHAVMVGPSSGSAAAPTFRSLVAADIPTISGNQVSGGNITPVTITQGGGLNITDTGGNTIVSDGEHMAISSGAGIFNAADLDISCGSGNLNLSAGNGGDITGMINLNAATSVGINGYTQYDPNGNVLMQGDISTSGLINLKTTTDIYGNDFTIFTAAVDQAVGIIDGSPLSLQWSGERFKFFLQTVNGTPLDLSLGELDCASIVSTVNDGFSIVNNAGDITVTPDFADGYRFYVGTTTFDENQINTKQVNVGIVAPSALSSTPSAGSSGQANIYQKGSKIVYQYNDAGTTRYKYLDLSGTGVTWVHTTSAP